MFSTRCPYAYSPSGMPPSVHGHPPVHGQKPVNGTCSLFQSCIVKQKCSCVESAAAAAAAAVTGALSSHYCRCSTFWVLNTCLEGCQGNLQCLLIPAA
jgi:hypothetical protein